MKAGSAMRQVNPTCCATAPRRQIVLNLLNSVLFLRMVNNYNLCCLPDLAVILLQQGFTRRTCFFWYLPGIFTQEVASDSTQITVATWIQRLPKEWSSRTLGQQSQLSHSPLTQRTQIIRCGYQKKRTAHMEPLQRVSFRRLWSSAKSTWSVLYPLGK